MALVLGQLGRAAMVDPRSVGLFVAAAVVLWRTRLNPTWVLLGSGLTGMAVKA